MYLMRECTGLSLVKIGEIFGGRDHTTALHGIKKVEDEMRSRDDTFRQVQDLTRIIRRPCPRSGVKSVDNLARTTAPSDAGDGPPDRATRTVPPSVPMSDTCRYAARTPHFSTFSTAPTTASLRRRP